MAEFIVLGAGMAGIGAALALQARGHAVTMVDRRPPGSETSHGNAGVIQAEAMEPYAFPRDLRSLWAYATGRSNDVNWHLAAIPGMFAALRAYFRHSSPARHAAISASYAQLIARATEDHGALIDAAGAGTLIRKTGLGEIYRSPAAFETAAATAARVGERYGVPYTLHDRPGLNVADPALKDGAAGLLIWTGSWSTSDPAALTRAYAALFETRGGAVVTGDATTLRPGGSGWEVTTADGPLTAANVVVALGPWSPALLKPLGYRVPMVLKRGYHGHYDSPIELRRPYLDAENGVVLASLTQGLRITTGAELTRQDAAPDLRQLRHGRRAAADLVEIGAEVPGGLWHGHRPCMPDMLPLVGAAPRHSGLWFDFGHGHQGLTLGPTTGHLLAEIVEGRRDALTEALSPAARGY